MPINEIKPIPFASLDAIAKMVGMSPSTLRVRLHLARKAGIPLPERKRIGKQFFYSPIELSEWLWQHGERLNRPAPFKPIENTNQ